MIIAKQQYLNAYIYFWYRCSWVNFFLLVGVKILTNIFLDLTKKLIKGMHLYQIMNICNKNVKAKVKFEQNGILSIKSFYNIRLI